MGETKVDDCKDVDLAVDLPDDRKKTPFKQLNDREKASMCRACTSHIDKKSRQCAFCPDNGKCRWTGPYRKTLMDKTYESCPSWNPPTEMKQCGFDFELAKKKNAEAAKMMDQNAKLNENRAAA